MIHVATIEGFRTVFMIGFALFLISSVTKWIRHFRTAGKDARNWCGSVGLVAGAISALLYAAFYGYLYAERELIAHGSALWIYYYTGVALAAFGLIAGCFGRSGLRRSALFINVVMLFQWWREMIPSVRGAAIASLMMFAVLAITSVVWLVALIIKPTPQN